MAIQNFTSGFGSVAKAMVGQKQALPSQQVASFRNQQLGGLLAGTSARPGPTDVVGALQGGLPNAQQDPAGVGLSVQRRTENVALSNKSLLGNAQAQRARNDALKRAASAQSAPTAPQARQQQGSAPGNTSFRQNSAPSAPRTSGGYVVGQAGSRIQSILTKYPGLRITETLGDRNYDQKNGVARRAQSYHYDKNDPAVDIGGSTAQLDKLYKELVAQGGWRQILWRSPGHYDHIHIA